MVFGFSISAYSLIFTTVTVLLSYGKYIVIFFPANAATFPATGAGRANTAFRHG